MNAKTYTAHMLKKEKKSEEEINWNDCDSNIEKLGHLLHDEEFLSEEDVASDKEDPIIWSVSLTILISNYNRD